MQKLLGWRGGTFHANAYYVHGIGPTSNTGSIFAVSNLEGFETVRLDELWFEQALLDDKLKIRIGALAADTEFFVSDTAGAFLNGTFGWAGILASDMIQGGPAYPLTSMGVRVAYTPNDNLTIMAALFNGSPADPYAADPQQSNRHGTDFRFGDGELLIVEGAYKYDAGLPGTVKLGGWKQFDAPAGIYTDFNSGATLRSEHGLYAIVDQQIWKGGDDRGINVFARVSGGPSDRSFMDFYFDTGVLFSGLVPGRAKDTFGAAFGYGQVSNELRGTDPTLAAKEAVLELNYTAQICDGITITPDFQYFWDPGATQGIDHAAVFGARTKISY